MSIKDYIHIQDSVLPAKTISKFLKYINKSTDFEAGLTTGEKDPKAVKKYRDVQIKHLFVDPFNFTRTHWHNLIEYVFRRVFKHYLEKIPHVHFEQIKNIQILKYEKSGHYKWHTDHSLSESRSVSAIFILNNDYEGGELCFLDQMTKEVFKVENKPGRLIMWPSNFMFPHSVAPVTKGIRYSVVLWAV
tara:strand:+ start:959 stop:1525 length:567 start_codon:yes stop_codon:yes gene_type:complete